jgi:hypothetical protein
MDVLSRQRRQFSVGKIFWFDEFRRHAGRKDAFGQGSRPHGYNRACGSGAAADRSMVGIGRLRCQKGGSNCCCVEFVHFFSMK